MLGSLGQSMSASKDSLNFPRLLTPASLQGYIIGHNCNVRRSGETLETP